MYGNDLDKLMEVSQDIEKLIGQVEGFENITNGQEKGDGSPRLVINKDKAMRENLTVAQIYSAISAGLTTEKKAATVTIDGQEMQVDILDEEDKLTRENLMNLELESNTTDDEGKSVTKKYKLKDFAKVKETRGVATISRENNTRMIQVKADTKDGYNTTKLSDQVQKLLDEYEMPQGYSAEISGETENTRDMLEQMVKMLALGLLFIYLVMVAQFQSLLSPFIILFTVPLAFTGGLIGLLIGQEQLSIMSLIGFLVLMGTVVNNGIVFVDYVNQLRIAGFEKREALLITGKTRMRPILMTALTTILSMCTLVFSQDTMAGASRGMAIVVAGGLLYATFMTLFIVPVMYDILYRKKPLVVEFDEAELDDDSDLLKV
ncbi:MAG: efflux RND transporter permease subunit [Oscillospiraceae bacterium]